MRSHSLFSLSFVLMSLAACTPPVATPVSTPTPALPSPPASAAVQTPAPQLSSPMPVPSVTPTQEPLPGHLVPLTGSVYDEEGQPVDGATVSITSLDSSVPLSATTTTHGGKYIFRVPEGINLEIRASFPGWIPRMRWGSMQTGGPFIIDFGAPAGPNPSYDEGYYLTRYPEISEVTPAFDATALPSMGLALKLVLSRALDATNQGRFAAALRLLPANYAAAPENDRQNADEGFTDIFEAIEALSRPLDPDPASYIGSGALSHPRRALETHVAGQPWDYTLKASTDFPNQAPPASVSWDESGTTATFNIKSPLISNAQVAARYQLALVAGPQPIVDLYGNQLGTNALGKHDALPPSGMPLRAIFTRPFRDPAHNVAVTLWNVRHSTTTRFSLAVDVTPPKLVSARYTPGKGANQSARLELSFSKPLGAYNGRPGGHVADNLRDGSILQGISFAVSQVVGGTANTPVNGLRPRYALDPMQPAALAGRELAFGSAAPGGVWRAPASRVPYGTELAAAEADPQNTGELLLALNLEDARTLFIYDIRQPDFFAPEFSELKVRVEGLVDSAGNAIDRVAANAQQLTIGLR